MKSKFQVMTLCLMLFGFMLTMGFISCKKDKSPVAQTLTDKDGNVYNTVKIGTQTWMLENLRVTQLNDGTPISNLSNATDWKNTSNAAYCWFNNDLSNKEKYGALYNWYAVKSGKLAPTGWHVPNDADWQQLRDYLIANGFNYDGTNIGDKIAKSLASTVGWNSNNTVGTIGNDPSTNNKSGFNALPAGIRNHNDGTFIANGSATGFWSSTQNINNSTALTLVLDAQSDKPIVVFTDNKAGFSIRCVKD